MDNEYLLSGRSVAIEPCPFDDICPPMFSLRILIFSLPPGQSNEDVVKILRAGLQATIESIPVLGCTVVPNPNASQGGVRAFRDGAARLVVKDLTGEMDIDELRAANYPQSMLSPSLLCPVPGFADPEKELAVCNVQANFIRGGLLLVWSIHHYAMDGQGMTTTLTEFANQCRLVQGLSNGHSGEAESKWPASRFDRSFLVRGSPPGSGAKLLDYYEVLPEPPRGIPAYLTAKGLVLTAETFRISPSALRALKQAASETSTSSSASSWISAHDAFIALIWRTVMKARSECGLFKPDQVVEIGMPVNFRRRIEPPLPLEYIGNAFMCSRTVLPLSQLIGPSGLVAGARALRSAITAVDTSYIDNFSAVMRGVADIRQVLVGTVTGLDKHQLFTTSYHTFGHSTLNWGQAFGKYEAFRLPKGGLANGCPVVMPPLPDGSWEVSITLEERFMQRVRLDEMWTKYTAEMYEESADSVALGLSEVVA